MFQRYFVAISMASVLFFSACANVHPPRRINTGVALPRSVPFDVSGKRTEDHHRGAFGADLNRSVGYNEAGETREANILSLHGEYAPIPPFAFGGLVFLSDDVGVEHGTATGIEGFLRWRPIAGEKFHFSVVPSIRYTENEAEDHFCRDISGIFVTRCNAPQVKAFASVKAFEMGANLLFEFYLKENNSIAFVPGAYYARVIGYNALEQFGASDTYLDGRVWNYSSMLYYLIRFGTGKAKMMFHVGAGASYSKDFAIVPHSGVSVKPLVDSGFSVGF